jgi:hypothetical protein
LGSPAQFLELFLQECFGFVEVVADQNPKLSIRIGPALVEVEGESLRLGFAGAFEGHSRHHLMFAHPQHPMTV